MFIIKHLQCVVLLVTGILISQAFAQPANLVLENLTISTTEFYEATNSITAGPNFTIASGGDVTLNAPTVTLKNMVFVVEGGELLVLSQTNVVNVKSDEPVLPNEFILNQNYPNPFNPSTKISYSVPNESHISLVVFDLLGQEVFPLVDEIKKPGYYEEEFDATSLPSGVYFYRLQAGDFVKTKKMMLMK